MKKIIIILLVAVLIYGYWQHQQSSQEVREAQKELWVIPVESEKTTLWKTADSLLETVDNGVSEIKDELSNIQDTFQDESGKETFEIEYLTDNKFLEFDTYKDSDLSDGEIELTGKTLTKVDKIRVLYTNKDSDHPKSDYTLWKFSAGDERFLYNAFSRHESFDFGTNHYTFFAYSWDEVAKAELTIYYPDPEKSWAVNTSTHSWEIVLIQDLAVDTLPQWAEYGSPVRLWENKATYSDIQWFEIESINTSDLDCTSENITKRAVEKSWVWTWWNTCRPIWSDSAISFFVLHIKDGAYMYSKHYYSTTHYAIIELESGEDETWANLESVADKNEWLKTKNSELKIRNDDFEIIKITDNLFTEITQ